MGTMELHFRRTKIAWFSCDTNTSQVGGGGRHNRAKHRSSKYSLTKCCTRFLASIKLRFSTWDREGAVMQFLEMSISLDGHVK